MMIVKLKMGWRVTGGGTLRSQRLISPINSFLTSPSYQHSSSFNQYFLCRILNISFLVEIFGTMKFVEAKILCHTFFFCFQQNWEQNTLHLWHIIEHKIARWGRWGRVIGLAGYRFQRQNWFIWDDIIYWHIPYVFEGHRIQQSWFIDLLSL